MSNCGFSLHWAGVFAWMASACTGPASSSDSAWWTNRCRCKGLIPSKRELTTATRKCVSLPAGTAWPPLSLRSSSTSGLRACSNLARIAASTGPPAADPALSRDKHARVAMETMHRDKRALSIRCREEGHRDERWLPTRSPQAPPGTASAPRCALTRLLRRQRGDKGRSNCRRAGH